MEVNELRVGNLYVNYEDKICPWGCDDFAVLWKNQGLEVDELIRNFIPLTEEWVLKTGLGKKNGYPYKFLNGFLKIRNGIYFFKYYDIEIDLPFVHQLQNLYFALTGEELAIA